MNVNLALLAVVLLILVFGWKHVPELMRGVKQGIDDFRNGFGGGGPRLRF